MRTVRLSAVVKDAQSGFASGEDDERGIIQVRMNNVTTDGGLLWTKIRRVPRPKNIDRLLAAPGDILFNATNSPDLVGKSALFTGYSEPVTFSNHFIRLRFDASVADSAFVSRVLQDRWSKRVFAGLCKQWVNQASVSKDDLLAIEIPLPPVDEQRRIAAILDQADELRRKRRLTLERLDGLPQAVFVEMFGDPVKNSKALPTKALGDLIKVRSGDALIGANQNGGSYPVYGGNGINGWHDKYIVPADTIVIGRVGVYCGAVHVTDRNAWVTDNALIVEIKSGSLLTTYLAAALKYADLNRYAGQFAQPLVSGSRIYPVKILTPPIDDQNVFGERFIEVKRLRSHYRAHLVKLDALFASIQHRAFTDERTSKDVERELAIAG
jgi:type I restriction enzyme, S subunit